MWSRDYNKAHIIAGGYSRCINILMPDMAGEGNGVVVTREDGGKLWLSHGTYILVDGRCPICEATREKKGE